MNADANGSRKAPKSWLPGAAAFLALAVYFNLRSDHAMTLVDWGVIALAALWLGYAAFRHLRDRP